ncbi:excinuclease ABC subunit UvrB [Candidatus Peregrinibacteria bacterium]|nr:excinuclease ABC subunit UvrB [Candidatus Peregrinibacteria bacterium]
MNKFVLKTAMQPKGDQPTAIKALCDGLKKGERFQTLLGVTGSGKTATMAWVVEELQRPTLVLAHNKTLAAQLCSEFQEFFPDNAVSYFVSYYDYYQPEAYLPATDTYIEKDASINEEIDKFRHAATVNLLTRKDVLIVASVSCIYGLGSVDDYETLVRTITVGDQIQRDKLLRQLTEIQYTRSAMEFKNGMFHVLGDTVEIFPPDRDTVFRIEFFGDEVDAISEVDSFTGELKNELNSVKIFPAKHSVTTKQKIDKAIAGIRADMEIRHAELLKMGRNIEAERIKTRTEYDIEILQETGYCSGIENYTRYLNGKLSGEPPTTLMDYLPDDFLLFIDESHMTVPQIGGMHNGNFSRKQTLIEHGFRLPSAHDNRPLKFEEFEKYMQNTVFVSATPGEYEGRHTPKTAIAEQVVRPTGLVDPEISVRPITGQIEDLLKEIEKRVKVGERVLITTLTKRSAEDLAEFLSDADVRVKYLHSDIETIERIEILRDLRLGKFDVLVGINLLREGLDLPEVSLVAILDADKEGFLRSASALVQTVGRCARNVNGFVIMYADKMTAAMKKAIEETDRRRAKQIAYNKQHGITPETIKKAIRDISHFGGKKKDKRGERDLDLKKVPKDEMERLVKTLEAKMDLASQNLEFEKAAELRDEIEALKEEFDG